MRCSDEKLSAFLDGDLSPRRSARVARHLEGCAACRASLEALRQMKGQLRQIAAPEAPDGWRPLVARLSQVEAARPRPALRWALPATALALSALAVAAALRHGRGAMPSDDAVVAEAEAEFRQADGQYRRAVDKLRAVVGHAEARMSSDRRRAYHDAAAQLEAATEKCRLVARTRPADPEAEELLFAAYRKQIGFFETQLLTDGARP
jgi:hypothetical protein